MRDRGQVLRRGQPTHSRDSRSRDPPMVADVLVLPVEPEAFVERDDVEVRIQPRRLHAFPVQKVQGGLHQGIPDVLSPHLRMDDHGADERELPIRDRARDPDALPSDDRDEAPLGLEVNQPLEVCAGVPPLLQVREPDRPAQVPLPEDPDFRFCHSSTLLFSSSTSSHSWYPYVMYRCSFRAFLYMHGPYSSSS